MVALVPLTPSQVLEDQQFLQSEIERIAFEKRKEVSTLSEQKDKSETLIVKKQERNNKHKTQGKERKESKRKAFLLDKLRSKEISFQDSQ